MRNKKFYLIPLVSIIILSMILSFFPAGIYGTDESSQSQTVIYEIESPGNNQIITSGSITFQGWAIDTAATNDRGINYYNIEYILGGYHRVGLFPNTNVLPRDDVAAEYGAQFIDSGFSHTINVSGYPNGDYVFVISFHSYVSDSITEVYIELSIQNPGGLVYNLDSPVTNQTITDGSLSVSGWVINPNLTSGSDGANISVFLDEATAINHLGTINNNCPSPAAESYGSQFANCGFSHTFDVSNFSNGNHVVIIKVYMPGFNNPHEIRSGTINIQTPPNINITYEINSPSDGHVITDGTLTVSGWARAFGTQASSCIDAVEVYLMYSHPFSQQNPYPTSLLGSIPVNEVAVGGDDDMQPENIEYRAHFSRTFNLSNIITYSNGDYTVIIKIHSALSGKWTEIQRTINLQNPEHNMFITIENPVENLTVEDDILIVNGTAYDEDCSTGSGIDFVSISIEKHCSSIHNRAVLKTAYQSCDPMGDCEFIKEFNLSNIDPVFNGRLAAAVTVHNAISNKNTTSYRYFNLQNPEHDTIITIENPSENLTIENGILLVNGTAYDEDFAEGSGIDGVQIAVERHYFFYSNIDRREMIDSKYFPCDPLEDCTFQKKFILSNVALYPRGTYAVAVTVHNASLNKYITVFKYFNLQNPEHNCVFSIDAPEQNQVITDGKLKVSGWVFDEDATQDSGIDLIYIRIPTGKYYYSSALFAGTDIEMGNWSPEIIAYVYPASNNPTPDLAGEYGEQFSNCGFSYTFDLSNVRYWENGTRAVQISFKNRYTNRAHDVFINIDLQNPEHLVHYDITSPSQYEVISDGTVRISGWAFDEDYTQGSGVSVDVPPHYDVTCNMATPEVQERYNNPAAGNCGFYKEIDVSNPVKYPYGYYTYNIRFYAYEKQQYITESRTVIINNPKHGIVYNINSSTNDGILSIDGWALDKHSTSGDGISYIGVLIDGPNLFTGDFLGYIYDDDLPSPEAAEKYGQRFSNCGFSHDFDISSYSEGTHPLYVILYSTVHNCFLTVSLTASVTTNIEEAQDTESTTTEEITEDSQEEKLEDNIFLYEISSPAKGQTINDKLVKVEGWAIITGSPGSGIDKVLVYMDGPMDSGKLVGSIKKIKIERPDIEEKYGSLYKNCGFSGIFDLSQYENGNHLLYVYLHPKFEMENNNDWILKKIAIILAAPEEIKPEETVPEETKPEEPPEEPNLPPKLGDIIVLDRNGQRVDVCQSGVKYKILVEASDPEGAALQYKWAIEGGGEIGDQSDNYIVWIAPECPEYPCGCIIYVNVTDGVNVSEASLKIEIVE